MEQARPKQRRKHSAQLKERVVAACAVPGASVARIALEHGLNANLVHRWRRVAEGRELGPEVKSVAAQFVSLPMATSIGSAPADIRIELKHGPTSIRVTWPMVAASECATWLRELLR